MNIGIFSKGNRQFGTGHIVRCNRIASRLAQLGHNPSLFLNIAPEYTATISSEVSRIELPEFDAQTITKAVKNLLFDTVVYDALRPELDVVDVLQNRSKKLVILDWQPTPEEIIRLIKPTTIVNGITGDLFPNTEQLKKSTQVQLFQGIKFAAINPKIPVLNLTKSHKQNRLLVFMGGSDPNNWTEKLLSDFCSTYTPILHAGLSVELVIGNYQNALGLMEATAQIARDLPKDTLNIVQNPPDFLERLTTCKAILSCGGITAFESIALGVFPVLMPQVEVQQPACEQLADKNLALLVSKCRTLDKSLLSSSLHSFVSEYFLDEQLESRLKSAIDGHGLNRVVSLIIDGTANIQIKSNLEME